ncbi:MAG: heavy metal translocating P-type ATPase [Chloroflexaceae bacterium]|nr:heavy metal translocating P-type ATPase [Chloroflexaceae bacterium]
MQTLIEQAADSIPRYPRRAFLEALTDTPSPSLISQARSSLQKRFPFLPFDSSVRRQQLTEMLSAEEKQRMIEANRERDQAIVIAFISFGFATAGQLLFWPLGLLSIPGILYVPRPIYQRTYNLLKQGKVGVPTLFTLTALGCIVSGYFWVASFGLLIVSLAFKYILQVTEETRYNLINVFQATPKFVWVLIDDQEIKTPIEEIAIGDVIVVHAGEAIPVDGSVISGMATVDQKFLTGEARPAEKESGDPVFASTVLLSGRISISVEKAGHDTTVARIGRVLNDTIDYKSSVQLRANTLADKTVLPTMVVSALALPLLGPMGALALMDSHFRYKLSFVVPLSLMNFLNIASQQGILIKDGRSLDLLSQVDTIVFDKTGTLTDEQPHIHAIHTYGAYHEDQVLTYAAAAEYRQTHPIAQAILEAAGQRNLTLPQIEDSAYKIGYGLTVHLASNLVQVGSYRFMEATDVSIPAELTQTQTACHELGHSLVLVAVDGAVVGAIELAPTIRPEARAIIQNLKQRPNIQSISIISGDQETPTRKLAQELGIDQYFAEILPEGKADIIQQLIDEGRFVCYVGDGINDSIALRKSHVSISLRGASTVATDTAQIIMMHGNLAGLPTVFDYAHDFYINTNVAFGLVLLPMFIGAGGVVFLGFGLFHTTILGVSGLMLGLGNSMVPAIKYRKLVHQPGTGHDTIVTEADADTIRALLAQT